ncbi:MAG: iron uptake system protein EfeO [Dermabacter sp.]|nr:iron uptake system protein EfeO [Dermabacter sp.]
MNATTLRLTRTAAATLLAAGLITGCTDNPNYGGASDAGGSAGPIAVTMSDTECTVAATETPSGLVTFSVTNTGTVPNEFEVLAGDKLRIISEKENIGPGSTVELTTALSPGDYFTACKPNMVGDFVGDMPFTVTEGEEVVVSEDIKVLEEQAVTQYTGYVKDQSGFLVTRTDEFVEAYLAGDTEAAKALYPRARKHYERIEPTAESFGINEAGDLDAALDLRIQDLSADAGTSVTDPQVLAEWTGWHRIEADLFSDDPAFDFPNEEERTRVARKLQEDTQTLYNLVWGVQEGADGRFVLTLEDVTTGASALMEEVATGKIVGEEETFSHTDLEDFQANLDGARVAWGNVAPIVEKNDPALAKDIAGGFESVQGELDTYRDGEDADGDPTFVDYSTIASVQEDAGQAPVESDYTDAQRKLSRAVNALSEDLSKVAAVVLH